MIVSSVLRVFFIVCVAVQVFAVATVVARVVYVEFVALSPVFVPLEVHENVPENVPD